MAGPHGTESLAAACSTGGLQQQQNRGQRQKLFAERVMPPAVSYSSFSDRGRRRKNTAGVASVAKAMAPEFGLLGSLVPTEAEFRSVASFAIVDSFFAVHLIVWNDDLTLN